MVKMIKITIMMDEDDDGHVGIDGLDEIVMIAFPTFVGDSFDCSNFHRYGHIELGWGCNYDDFGWLWPSPG